MLNTRTLLIACWLSLLVAGPSLCLGQAAAPAAKPPEVLLEWSTANMRAFSDAWLRTTPGKTSQSPALTTYRQALTRHDVGALFYLRPWIGIDWSDLAAVDQRVTIVLVPAGKTKTDIAIWIQGKSDSTGVQTCRAAATAYWNKSQYRLSSRRSDEMEIQRFARQTKAGQTVERYLVSTRQGMLLTTRATDHQSLIASFLNQAPDDIASEDNSAAATASFALKPLSLVRQRRTTSKDNRNWALSAERLGAEQLNQLRGSMRLDPTQQCPIEFELRCAKIAPLKQAIRLLEMPQGGQLSPISLACAKDDTLSVWRWDCRPAMKAFGNLFDEMVDPGEFGEGLFEDLLDGLKEDPEGPQVDLRRDLFDRLGPRFRAHAQVSDAKTNQRQWIYGAECAPENAKHVQATLEAFFKGDRAVTREVVGKYTCWSVAPAKSLFIEVESENISSFRAVAIGPEGFFVATEPALLKATLTNATPSSEADRALWLQLLQASEKHVPGDSSARVLVNTQRRFTAALSVAYTKAPPYQNWEPGLLRWIFYGDDADSKKLTSKDLPSHAEMQGFFLPAWLVFQQLPDELQLKMGFLDNMAPTQSE